MVLTYGEEYPRRRWSPTIFKMLTRTPRHFVKANRPLASRKKTIGQLQHLQQRPFPSYMRYSQLVNFNYQNHDFSFFKTRIK